MKTGKNIIANLPSHLRDELNYRLADGEEGPELLPWLNAKPEVVEVVNQRFDALPISEANLSEWRQSGYQKWLAHHNFVDESNALSDNTEDIAETGIDCDKLLLTLTAAYADMIRNWIITPGEQMTYKLAVYKNLTNGVIALQRAELQKVRLEIARERLELLREKRRHKSPSSSGPFTETASPPESAPGSNQSPATAGSLQRAEAPNAPDGSPIPQNIAPPHTVVAPSALPLSTSPKPSQPNQPTLPTAALASEKSDPRHSSFELRHSSTPAPRPNSSAPPVIRRANVPPNTLHGIPFASKTVRPAPCPAPGYATQTPKPPAPKVAPSRPTVHR